MSAHRSAPTPRAGNQVRIIGGRWRGRIVRFAPGDDLRPTPNRVRETLFNWLGQDLRGRRTLDPFSGTGALSFEALSRGAELAVAFERAGDRVRSIEAAARMLGADALELHRADALDALRAERRIFDVVFLDPPFRLDLWDEILPLSAARIREGGSIYCEAAVELAPPAGLVRWRHDKAGHVHYHLLRREA